MEGIHDDPFNTVIGLKFKVGLIFCSILSIVISTIVGNEHQREYNRYHPPSNTIYKFEVVRHGARAPLIKVSDDEWPFPVRAEMLSPAGMR